MKATRLIALLLLSALAQGASATTVWLKDRNGQVCKNSASGNAGVVGIGGVDRNGVMTMTIDNPDTGTETRNPSVGDCANLPRTSVGSPLVLSGSGLVTPQIVPIHMWKPGTNGAMECLDQGSNFVGLKGTLVNGQKMFLFSGGLLSDGCDMSSQTKTTLDGLPVFRREVSYFNGGERPRFIGAYHIFNEANSVPEPGSLLLLVVGATSLIFVGMQRRRLAKQAQI